MEFDAYVCGATFSFQVPFPLAIASLILCLVWLNIV